MKSGVLKCTKRLDFIFEFEYRNTVLSKGTLIHKRGRGSCAQENLQKTMRDNPTTKKGLLVKFTVKPGVSGLLSGMSGQRVRSIWTYTRSLRVTVTCPQNSLVRSLRTQVSGVSGHIPRVSGYPSPNG
jgi:hypothetical protein